MGYFFLLIKCICYSKPRSRLCLENYRTCGLCEQSTRRNIYVGFFFFNLPVIHFVLRKTTICSEATNNYNMFYLLFIFCCKELKQIILRCWHVLLLQDRVRENRCQSLQNCLRRRDFTSFIATSLP